jgi:hypothetical protein
MTKIGVLSDTHGYVDNEMLNFFKDCDEIWHAGDIGSIYSADKLAAFKTFHAVHGNIDGHELRITYPKLLRFYCEEVDVLITHIGGYPNHYEKEVQRIFNEKAPKLFIAGHSHILKVIYDKKYDLLHINPGAAGYSGFQLVRTAVRFSIDKSNIRNLEVIEFKKRFPVQNI